MSDQQVFSDRYELVRHIARGGMAEVYLAKDGMLDRPVALKVLFPELSVDRSFVERFRREAQAAANLAHPNIVSIYDWGQGDRTYFIVMEYIDGHTLSSLIRQGALDVGRAAFIGAEVAKALEFAHQRGVIHRDVKPGNVLIDQSGQVKVTDFGIARAIGAAEGLTQTGSVMGTATYFSPEQAQGHPVDARSDVYSLGVVLYEMVVGRPPFAGDNPVSIAYKHVREAAPRPSSVNRAVPAAFEAIVLKAIAKDPADRYQSAAELRADLLRYQHGGPVMADGAAAPTLIAAGMAAGGDVTAIQRRADPTSALPLTASGNGTGAGNERRSHTALFVTLLVVLLIALGVLVFFLGRSLGWWSLGSSNATIPADLAGQSVSQARGELARLGFTQVKQTPAASSRFGIGDVITTRPPPGTSQPLSEAVTLVVSTGPAQVTIPDVNGFSSSAATKALRAKGFVVTDVTQNSDTVPADDVITTNPGPNQPATKGSTVQLVVSLGKAQVTIPSLVGESPSQAGQKLGALQLVVGGQTTEPSSSVPNGEVTRTNPPAGTAVSIGSSVTIYVSSGPPQIKVPNLTGDTQAQAQAVLQAAGLQASFTPQPTCDPTQNNMVLSQNPAAGTPVDQSSTVGVVIGSFSGPGPAVSGKNTSPTSPTTACSSG